jgi:hypothetical protein
MQFKVLDIPYEIGCTASSNCSGSAGSRCQKTKINKTKSKRLEKTPYRLKLGRIGIKRCGCRPETAMTVGNQSKRTPRKMTEFSILILFK